MDRAGTGRAARGEPDLVILAGIEVSAYEGHFLAYGVANPFAVPKGIRVAALCREVHAQGGAVVAAHPFRWNQPFEEIFGARSRRWTAWS